MHETCWKGRGCLKKGGPTGHSLRPEEADLCLRSGWQAPCPFEQVLVGARRFHSIGDDVLYALLFLFDMMNRMSTRPLHRPSSVVDRGGCRRVYGHWSCSETAGQGDGSL